MNKRLSAIRVQKESRPGRYADGNGLYLQVSKTGNKSWLLRFQLKGRARQMGLGPVKCVSLAEARELAIANQKLLLTNVDPIEARTEKQRLKDVEEAKAMTFDECAKAFMDAHSAKWRNQKHVKQWESTLRTYASPIIGNLPVQAIDTDFVLRVLEPIWTKKTETASRVRGRMESVLDWATVRQLRSGENPARWRGHLDKLLPKPTEVSKVKHHAALPVREVGSFMKQLEKLEGVAPKALEFLILTASRTGEVIYAKWNEIDFAKEVWTVPPERMKHKRAHRVPLCPRAISILSELNQSAKNEYIFPGWSGDKPLSGASLLHLLKKTMSLKITAHGFRSTFRDWAAEHTNFPSEVVEMALSHTIESKVEAAYRRGDLLLKRRSLMLEWERFCSKEEYCPERVIVKMERRQA